eukprot:9786296-Lingulodinium_polyedra.AAC.1
MFIEDGREISLLGWHDAPRLVDRGLKGGTECNASSMATTLLLECEIVRRTLACVKIRSINARVTPTTLLAAPGGQ